MLSRRIGARVPPTTGDCEYRGRSFNLVKGQSLIWRVVGQSPSTFPTVARATTSAQKRSCHYRPLSRLGGGRQSGDALDVLKTLTIVLPVWDAVTGQGSNTQYHVVGFARIQITSYQLPGQDRITAIYRGPATCQ